MTVKLLPLPLLLLLLVPPARAQPDFGSAVGRSDLATSFSIQDLRRERQSHLWRVTADRVELEIEGKPAGYLYRTSVLEGEPVTGDASRVAIAKLESAYLLQAIADKYRVRLDDGSSVVRGIDIDVLPLWNREMRSSGKLTSARTASLRESVGTTTANTDGRVWIAVTPLGATVPAQGLEKIQDDALNLDMLNRLQSAGVEVRMVLVDGTEWKPKLTEVLPFDPQTGSLGRVDYEGGYGDEMRYYKSLAHGRPLYVFLSDEPDKTVPYENVYVPLKKRQDWDYRSFSATLLDGKGVLREPLPSITIPRHLTKDNAASLAETLKHETGHVIHSLAGEIHNEGYDESFGLHTFELRTNAQSAMVEGFAEYTAFKFRDSSWEGDPLPMERLLSRTEPAAHKTLLWFYWDQVQKSESIARTVAKTELETLGESFHRAIYEENPPPSFSDFRTRVVTALTGKGKPPLTAAAVEKSISAVDKRYNRGVDNVKDEEWSAERSRELSRAFDSVVEAGTAEMTHTGSKQAYTDANARFDRMVQRSPTDLMMNEGFVSAMLLELDRQLSSGGLNFYSKVLSALKQDPYGGRSSPRVPITFKELVAVLDRDPDLNGKLLPVVEKVTNGILKSDDFKLARRREDDPLLKARPGHLPPGADESAGRTVPMTGDAALLYGARASGSADTAPLATGPHTSPEEKPDFGQLRGR